MDRDDEYRTGDAVIDNGPIDTYTGAELDAWAETFFGCKRQEESDPAPVTDEELRRRCRDRWNLVGTFDNRGTSPAPLDLEQVARVKARIDEALSTPPRSDLAPRAKAPVFSWADIEVKLEPGMSLADFIEIKPFKVEPPRVYAPESSKAVEHEMPAPYVGGPRALEGATELAPLRFEVVRLNWEKPSNYDHQAGHAFGYMVRKSLELVTRQRPRGDEDPAFVKGEGEQRWVEITFRASFAPDRPDALCIRELVMLAMRHELEESIKVNGVRVWDPHVGRPFDI